MKEMDTFRLKTKRFCF